MEYKDFDGNDLRVEGGYEFSMTSEKSSERWDNGRIKNYCRLVGAPIQYKAETLFSDLKKIVASNPPFLVDGSEKWIAAYLDSIELHVKDNYSITDNEFVLTGESIMDMAAAFAITNDAISATRMFFTIDIIVGLLARRQMHGHDYFTSDDNYIDQFEKAVELSIFDGSYYLHSFHGYRDIDKKLKTNMTRNVYKNTMIIVSIPDGEELQSFGRNDKTMILNPGSSFSAKIVRFYKTELCWANRATFEFYPTMIGIQRCRFPAEPMLAVEMEMAEGVANSLGWGVTINAFIPLHWVTHVKWNGQYRYVKDTPVASHGSPDNLPVVLTRSQFEEYGWRS
jgi:hypothetical protein